jgi:hypothetical protein
MTEFDLTTKEFHAACVLMQQCLDGMGGSRPSDLEHDEFTWVYAQDLVTVGYSKHEAAGLFSSLAGKSFLEQNSPKDWVITTEGWRWMDTQWNDK